MRRDCIRRLCDRGNDPHAGKEGARGEPGVPPRSRAGPPGPAAPRRSLRGSPRNKIEVLHGVIFTSFRDFLTEAYGDDLTRELFAQEPIYLLSEAYPDERLLELISRTSGATGRSADEVEHDFGVFTGATTFTRLYPAFFAIAPTAREFLLTVESRIHELVRATIPHAVPPRLAVSELDDDGVSIDYSSPRHLCMLLRGLVEGTARHYDETATIDELACMREGAQSCRFEVRLSHSSPGA